MNPQTSRKLDDAAAETGRSAAEAPVLAPPLLTHTEPQGPGTMSRWLWFAYPLALIGIAAVWGSLTAVLLGRQVGELVPDPRQAAGALGATLGVGSLIGLVAQPVMGRLSDKTSGRFLGRRNIWILFGSLGGAAGLMAIAASDSLIMVAVLYAVAMLPLCGLQAALTAVLPERVPLVRRGTMSGIVGTTSVVGGMIGVTLAGLVPSIFVAYLLVAAVMVATATLFAFTTKDVPAPTESPMDQPQQRRAANKLPGFRTHSDFWWTFAGRFFVIFGYFIIAGFNLYLLRDYIGVGDGSLDAASQALVGVTLASSVLTLLFSVAGGVLSDRFGKVKIFVALAAVLLIPAAVVFLTIPTFNGFIIASMILGSAFGMYTAVDQVLITRVLPTRQNVARDLGLINIANSGPQVLAPVIAGAIIAATGNYTVLFYVSIAAFLIAAVTVRFINSVP